MRRWHGVSDVPPDWTGSVVTIGVFDGVHRGHQRVIRQTVARAQEAGLPAVVVTFDPHPAAVLRPEAPPLLLSTPRFRLDLMEDLGVDAVCVLAFTAEFSRLEPEEFVKQILVDSLRPTEVVVGENFRFGRRAAGTVELLGVLGEKYGYAVTAVPLQEEGPGHVVSSTYVRDRLSEGDVSNAARALGRPHRVEGTVVRGTGRGRELLGFPTANVECPPHTAVPADGVYAGWLLVEAKRYPAAISVGTNVHFDAVKPTVEPYVLDRDDLELYGQWVEVEFAAWIRAMARFPSIEDLRAAMTEDVRTTRELLVSS